MKTIKITDCQNNQQFLNTELIYNINIQHHKDGDITQIHLNHKDDNYSFATFKTFEPLQNILNRLKELE